MYLKALKISALVLLSILMLTGCMPAQTASFKEEEIEFVQFNEPKEGQETAVITTSMGTITMILFEKEAPNTVEHFKRLIKDGYYNNKEILTQSKAKTIITGALNEDGSGGKLLTDDKKPIKCETNQNLWHFSGAVSVLGYEKNKFSKTILSDSKFFIIGNAEASSKLVSDMEKYEYPKKVIDKYMEKGGLPQYTGKYTVFGQVIDGIEIVNKISSVKVDEETNKPLEKIVIEKIELSKYTKDKK